MEDTLRESYEHFSSYSRRLNPCSNGRYSQNSMKYVTFIYVRLNPCSNGRYSQRGFNYANRQSRKS